MNLEFLCMRLLKKQINIYQEYMKITREFVKIIEELRAKEVPISEINYSKLLNKTGYTKLKK